MTRISSLPEETAPTSTDSLPMLDTETMTTKRTTIAKLQPMDNPYKFSVYRSTAQNTGNAAYAKIQFNSELFDTNNDFDSSTNYRYTAPINGYYHFDATYGAGVTSDTQIVIITLYKNGTEIVRGNRLQAAGGGGNLNPVVAANLQLSAGDYIEVYAYGSAAFPLEVSAIGTQPKFGGFLISRT